MLGCRGMFGLTLNVVRCAMIHSFPVLEDLPLFHLELGDVLLVEPGHLDPVGVYRSLPLNYAALLPTLVSEGAVSTSLNADDLACVAQLLPPSPDCAPRSGLDRRQDHLKLLVSGEGG
jgi:hypothetical protein